MRIFNETLKCLMMVVLALSASAVFAGKPQNIVVFLVDDLGWIDTGCYGSAYYQTPYIDRLAAEGVRFTQAYSAHPRCVPARYALMTGKFPARDGVPGRSYNMDPEEVTVAEALSAANYATFFAGKWHLSKSDAQKPDGQGFDVNIAGGHAGAPGSYFYPYRNPKKNKGHNVKNHIELEGGQEGEYLTDRLTDESIAFLREHTRKRPDQPFFVYLSHYAVHTPLEGKPEKVQQYAERVKQADYDGPSFTDKDGTTKMHQDNPEYAAMVESTDESLGRIMQELQTLGLSDQTVLMLTSDHGGLSNRGTASQRNLATSNLPLRAGKGHCYEGGIRVPFIVKWPGITRAGTVSDAVISGTDLFPTCLEIAGQPLRPDLHLDGISISPALRGENFERPGPLFWHSPKGRPNQTGDRNCSAIRKGNYKLIDFFNDGRVELYDLKKDPSESNDLSQVASEITESMLNELRAWRLSVNAFMDKKEKNK